MATKTNCPISRSEFTRTAVQVPVTIGTKDTGVGIVYGQPKTFSTGSLGFYANGKVTLLINGKPTVCQVGVNITVVGSKELSLAEGTEVAVVPAVPPSQSPEVAKIRADMKAKELAAAK